MLLVGLNATLHLCLWRVWSWILLLCRYVQWKTVCSCILVVVLCIFRVLWSFVSCVLHMNSNCNTDSQPVYFILYAFLFSFFVDGTGFNSILRITFAIILCSTELHEMLWITALVSVILWKTRIVLFIHCLVRTGEFILLLPSFCIVNTRFEWILSTSFIMSMFLCPASQTIKVPPTCLKYAMILHSVVWNISPCSGNCTPLILSLLFEIFYRALETVHHVY